MAVDLTWRITQQQMAAYNTADKRAGKKLMIQVMDQLKEGLPNGLKELATLGRTLNKRKADILAYFDLGASNGPVEAINGRLEHLRGIALGFKNLEHFRLAVPATRRATPIKAPCTLDCEEPTFWWQPFRRRARNNLGQAEFAVYQEEAEGRFEESPQWCSYPLPATATGQEVWGSYKEETKRLENRLVTAARSGDLDGSAKACAFCLHSNAPG